MWGSSFACWEGLITWFTSESYYSPLFISSSFVRCAHGGCHFICRNMLIRCIKLLDMFSPPRKKLCIDICWKLIHLSKSATRYKSGLLYRAVLIPPKLLIINLNKDGLTPLMLATKNCNTTEVCRLLDQKANVEATDLVCYSTLMQNCHKK